MSVMAERPSRALWGIGARTARKLAEGGVSTVAELTQVKPASLIEWFGPVMGPSYGRLALGAGETEVRANARASRVRTVGRRPSPGT